MTAPLTPFQEEVKNLILEAADKEEPAGGLTAEEAMFGPESRLQLDSLDALQISMALQKRYGVRMTDSKETRRAMTSLAHLADHLTMHRP
ncbi:MAG TPA: acyl carrier protein [Gammaproteobacteria bacterium]